MSIAQRTRWIHSTLGLLMLGFVLFVFVGPLAQLLAPALMAGNDVDTAFAGPLSDPVFQESLLRTIAVALLSCGLASLIAVPAAFASARGPGILKPALLLFGTLPLLIPPFVTASLLRDGYAAHLLGEGTWQLAGMSIDRASVVLSLVYAVHYLPLMVLALAAGLGRLDRAFAECARNLGAGRLFTWRHVTLPMTMPAFALGAGLMILKVVEDIGTPLLLGVEHMLGPQLLLRFRAGSDLSGVTEAALLMTLLSGLVVILAWGALVPLAGRSENQRSARTLRWGRGAPRLISANMILLAVTVVGILPLAVLWPLHGTLDLSIVSDLASSGAPMQVLVSVASGLTLVLIGTLSMALIRDGGFSANLLRAIIGLSLAVPGAVVAMAIRPHLPALPVEGPFDPVGPALAIVIAFKTLPYLPHLLVRWRRSFTLAQRELAHTLGSGRTHALLRGLLPLPPLLLLAVFLLGVAAAMNEWSAALILSQQGDATVAAELFSGLHLGQDSVVFAARIVMLLALTTVTLLPALWLFGSSGRRHIRRPVATTMPVQGEGV